MIGLRPKPECDLLESVARHLEAKGGNELYRKAWRRAAKDVRNMKKLTEQAEKLNDKPEQIVSNCARPV